jgi:hypothetical protein
MTFFTSSLSTMTAASIIKAKRTFKSLSDRFMLGICDEPPACVPGGDLAKVPYSCTACACHRSPQLFPLHGVVWITSSTSCTPSRLLSTGTPMRLWRKVNSRRPVRILLLMKKITRKLALILLTASKKLNT